MKWKAWKIQMPMTPMKPRLITRYEEVAEAKPDDNCKNNINLNESLK